MKITYTPQIGNQKIRNKISSNTSTLIDSDNVSSRTQMSSYAPLFYKNMTFTGGASVNLAETIASLDKLAIHNDKVYPPGIRDWAKMAVESVDFAKKTLIDVHKEYYKAIDEIFSLEKLKKDFPEFKNVISDGEVTYSKGSFMEKVKTNNLACFDSEEDLTLQLIKLYWAKGFSLNDIKGYAGNEDVYYTMKKLNIPLVDNTYGRFLKFSDPEYNERLTREMTAKRLEALEIKSLQETGEPVYIPRGPLSDEHKKKISEGLIKHYEEHPEKIFEMSKRQKEFYAKHPDRAEFFARVMKKVWGIQSNQRLKVAIVDFFHSNGVKEFSQAQVENPTSFSTLHSALLKDFWGKNEWAREAFAKTVKYSWKKAKEEQMSFFEFNVLPKAFVNKLLREDRYLDPNSFMKKIYPFEPQLNNVDIPVRDNAVKTVYLFKNPDEMAKLKDTFTITILTCFKKLASLDKSRVTPQRLQAITEMEQYIRRLFENPKAAANDFQLKECTPSEFEDCYRKLIAISSKDQNNLIVKLLNDTMESAYLKLDNLAPNQGIVIDIRSEDLKIIPVPKN